MTARHISTVPNRLIAIASTHSSQSTSSIAPYRAVDAGVVDQDARPGSALARVDGRRRAVVGDRRRRRAARATRWPGARAAAPARRAPAPSSVLVARGEQDAGAGLDEARGDRPAQALVGAGDDGATGRSGRQRPFATSVRARPGRDVRRRADRRPSAPARNQFGSTTRGAAHARDEVVRRQRRGTPATRSRRPPRRRPPAPPPRVGAESIDRPQLVGQLARPPGRARARARRCSCSQRHSSTAADRRSVLGARLVRQARARRPTGSVDAAEQPRDLVAHPVLVRLVARQHAVEQRRRARRARWPKPVEEAHVARQRAAGEGGAGRRGRPWARSAPRS